MNINDYDYELPEELIAQIPSAVRSESRLLVLNRRTGELAHEHFYNLPGHLQKGDLLIANDSRVIPARLIGTKDGTGAVIEVLLLRPLAEPGTWQALIRPGKRLKVGQSVTFGDGVLQAQVLRDLEDGIRVVAFSVYGDEFDRLLDSLGEMPLPPYIKARLGDKERYQTVYARHQGSVAAPTAGLHFTPELMAELRQRGVQVEFVTLHVGLGTFRPVQVEDVTRHHMHTEWYSVPVSLLATIAATRAAGYRVVSVGTTTVRALESAARKLQEMAPDTDDPEVISGMTDLFIYPGFSFQVTDAMVTNFHLPKSTLLMLVSALAGRDAVLQAYRTAVLERYRFFSFGDAMLII